MQLLAGYKTHATLALCWNKAPDTTPQVPTALGIFQCDDNSRANPTRHKDTKRDTEIIAAESVHRYMPSSPVSRLIG